MTVFEILADVAARFEALGIEYTVGGSLASSTWGQMRHTNDADVAIRISKEIVPKLLAAFADPYVLSEREIEETLSTTSAFRSVQLLHMDEAFKLDLFILNDGPYETSELERSRPVEVLPGVFVRFCAPENIVIMKLRWFVLGNKVSDRQWNDIIQVLEVQSDHLDEAYLHQWANYFDVEGLLQQAQSQAFP